MSNGGKRSPLGLVRSLTYVLRSFRLVWESDRFATAVALMAAVLQALFPIAALYVTKHILDAVAGTALGGDARMAGGSIFGVLLPTLAGIWMLRAAMAALTGYCAPKLQITVHHATQAGLLRKCAKLDMCFFESPAHLDMLENAGGGGSSSIYPISTACVTLLATIVGLCGYLFVLVRFRWQLAAIGCVASLPQLLAAARLASRRWALDTDLAQTRRLLSYYSSMVTQRRAVAETKFLGLSEIFVKRYRSTADKVLTMQKGFHRSRSLLGLGVRVISLAGAAVCWILILRLALAGAISVGDVVLYTGAVASVQSALANLSAGGGHLMQTVMFAGNYFRLIDLDPSSIDGALRRLPPKESASARNPPKAPPEHVRLGVEFQNVSFRYPHGGHDVLRNVSFSLRPGESVAVVGRNGAGKTTLVKLLLRLYDPTGGRILLDGTDIREYDLEDLRRRFAAALEDYVRYPLSLRENIGFGSADSVDDLARIQEAATRVGADKIAEKLPDHYDTDLGKQFGGSRDDLSNGEWQRIALARMAMRSDALVLVFDEPTSALDALAEAEVIEAMRGAATGKASLTISHRFSTVRAADHIVLLSEGRVTEQGNHSELLARAGEYARMYAAQARRYGV